MRSASSSILFPQYTNNGVNCPEILIHHFSAHLFSPTHKIYIICRKMYRMNMVTVVSREDLTVWSQTYLLIKWNGEAKMINWQILLPLVLIVSMWEFQESVRSVVDLNSLSFCQTFPCYVWRISSAFLNFIRFIRYYIFYMFLLILRLAFKLNERGLVLPVPFSV